MPKVVCFLKEFYSVSNLHLRSQNDDLCAFMCKKCDFIINNMFQLQYVATSRSVELIEFNLKFLGPTTACTIPLSVESYVYGTVHHLYS